MPKRGSQVRRLRTAWGRQPRRGTAPEDNRVGSGGPHPAGRLFGPAAQPRLQLRSLPEVQLERVPVPGMKVRTSVCAMPGTAPGVPVLREAPSGPRGEVCAMPGTAPGVPVLREAPSGPRGERSPPGAAATPPAAERATPERAILAAMQ